MEERALQHAQSIRAAIEQRIDNGELNTHLAIRRAIIQKMDGISVTKYSNQVHDSFLLLYKDQISPEVLKHEGHVQYVHASNAAIDEPALYTALDSGLVTKWVRNSKLQWHSHPIINFDKSSRVKCMEPLGDRRLAIGVDHSPSDRIFRSSILLYNKLGTYVNYFWKEDQNICIYGAINTLAFTRDESRCAVSMRVNDARNQLLKIFARSERSAPYCSIASIPLNGIMKQLRWQSNYSLEMQDDTDNAFKVSHNNDQRSWSLVAIAASCSTHCRNDIKWNARSEGSNVIVDYPVPLLSSVVLYLLEKSEERKRLKDFPPLPSSRTKEPHAIESSVEVHTPVTTPQYSANADNFVSTPTTSNESCVMLENSPVTEPKNGGANQAQAEDQDYGYDEQMEQLAASILEDDK
jgi:hypothetical protein